jgi:hypothetical protein
MSTGGMKFPALRLSLCNSPLELAKSLKIEFKRFWSTATPSSGERNGTKRVIVVIALSL